MAAADRIVRLPGACPPPERTPLPAQLPADVAAANDMLAFLVDAFERSGKRMAEMDSVPELQAAPQVQRLAQRVARLMRRFEETLNHLAVGVIMVDSNGRTQLCNDTALRMLGLPVDMMKARPQFLDVIAWQIRHGEFSEEEARARRWISENGVIGTAPYFRRKRPNGAILDVRTVQLADGGFVRTFTEVTEEVSKQQRLEAAEAEYRSLFENATIGIYRSSLDGRQLRANPALARLNGYESEQEMLAGAVDINVGWYVDPGRRAEFVRLMQRDGRVSDFVSEVWRHKTRERIWVSENAWLVTDAQGSSWFEGTVMEVTERVEQERRIAHLAMHDQATGLANRRRLMNRAQKLLDDGSGRRVAAFLIDLDGFKAVNDTFGHACGDQLLMDVAILLQKLARPGALVARYGGDEFVILCAESCQSIADIAVSARMIVEALEKPFRIGDRLISVGASVGVGFAEAGGCDAEELMRRADVALYKAKGDGKRTYRLFAEEMMKDAEARLETEAALRCAIAGRELSVHYQPIVALPSRTPVACEALLRWSHPVSGAVSPGVFVPIAEQAGLMGPLGALVVEQVAADLARIPEGRKVAINVSGAQLRDQGFLPHFAGLLWAKGADPSRIVVEITETVLINSDSVVMQTLDGLRRMGVTLALDDFGTGYSALSYLQKFRFDRIKLDQSFLADGGATGTNAAIIRAILALGRELGIPIVAEGVETEDQARFLIEAGCAYAQGWLFGRPAPIP